jgi:hypothetical protein
MNWLFPGFFAAGLAIGLPVLLHFLRSKPKVVIPFPTLRLLGETAIRDTRRHRLRRWLTLLLRCLVIALLAAAFARPFWVNASLAHRRVLLIAVDNSMSMQATGRWEELRAQALRQLDELGAGDQAALLLMQPRPAWLVPMTDDLARVRTALQHAEPGFENTHYAPALQMASEALAATPGGERTLFWMADEQQTGWAGTDFAQKLPAGIAVHFADPSPAAKRQAAITALAWSDLEKHDHLKITVRLFEPLQDTRKIIVTAAGEPLATQTLPLQVGDNTFDLPLKGEPKTAGVRVALDADDLPGDDVAWIATQKPAAGAVLLDAGAGTDFLRHALLATSKLATGGFVPMDLPSGEWPKGAVAILRNAATFQPPAVERLNHFVEAGGAVWMFVDGSTAQSAWLKARGVVITERLRAEEAQHLRDWDPDHPALAAFAGQSLLPLLEVEFYHGFDLAGSSLTPLANWPDGPAALAEWNGDGRRVLLAGFPPAREATNWPAQPSFVPFVHQAIRWLGSFNAAHSEWRIGDTIPLEGTGKWHALDTLHPAADREVTGSVRPSTPGLYEFSSGEKTLVFAVNAPLGESDLAPLADPDQLAQLARQQAAPVPRSMATATLSDEVSENQQRLWWWVLAACSLAILAELALANRTAM